MLVTSLSRIMQFPGTTRSEETLPMAAHPGGFFEDLARYAAERDRLSWEGTFEQYLNLLASRPALARNAHRLVYESLVSRPEIFTAGPYAMFGAEETIGKLLEFLRAGGEGLEPRKRILLLVGPPGSGKSTLIAALKRGVEQFTRIDAGGVYQIASCPMHEDPLNLVPEEMRPSLESRLDIKIEGHLCPRCQKEYGGSFERIRHVRVKRTFFSERDRIGIGTFQPSDPKSQDITELVGSVDFSRLPEFGTASDPDAYCFDGELNIANRGVMEFVEMLKCDVRFLYALLSVTTERVIKAPRFANIYADLCVIAHTNETEFKRFIADKASEALHDRVYIIPVPYSLRRSDEVRIYEKLIKPADGVHICPNTFKVAATFALLSRLEDSKQGISREAKMKLYDGQDVADLTERDLKELREQSPREGMQVSISPRFVVDSLSRAMIQDGRKCLTPIDALRALKKALDTHPHTRDLASEHKEEMRNLLDSARSEYNDIARRVVRGAFVYSFEESAERVCSRYLENVEAYLARRKVKDPVTDDDIEPDENLMTSIEEGIGVAASGKNEFRNEIMQRIASLALRGEKFNYQSHRRLKEAIEAKLFNDLKDTIVTATSSMHPDEEHLRRRNQVAETLIAERGYCPTCANETIKYVGTLLSR